MGCGGGKEEIRDLMREKGKIKIKGKAKVNSDIINVVILRRPLAHLKMGKLNGYTWQSCSSNIYVFLWPRRHFDPFSVGLGQLIWRHVEFMKRVQRLNFPRAFGPHNVSAILFH